MDVRKVEEQDTHRYSVDDLLFDVVAGDGYEGEYSDETYGENGEMSGVPVESVSGRDMAGWSGDERVLERVREWLGECCSGGDIGIALHLLARSVCFGYDEVSKIEREEKKETMYRGGGGPLRLYHDLLEYLVLL